VRRIVDQLVKFSACFFDVVMFILPSPAFSRNHATSMHLCEVTIRKLVPGFGVLILGVVACAFGMLALAFGASPPAVAAGAVLLGLGFGVAQNASLTLMFDRVSASGYDMVSAVWNLAYDAGMGVGAAGFGVLAARAGYAGAFGIVAASMLIAVAPAWRDRRWLTPGEDLGSDRVALRSSGAGQASAAEAGGESP